MLQLAADRKVQAWVETRPMEEVRKALVDFKAGKPRYRYVLTD